MRGFDNEVPRQTDQTPIRIPLAVETRTFRESAGESRHPFLIPNTHPTPIPPPTSNTHPIPDPFALSSNRTPAMYKGDTRVRTVEVYVEGVLATTWSSSGTTTDFESIDLSGYSAQHVTLVGVLAKSEWLSIVEVETRNTWS